MRSRLFSAITLAVVMAAGFGIYQVAQPSTPTYTVTADVAQAPNLFEGGRVMVRGVEVGRIDVVEPHSDGVRLKMTIEEGVKVPADASLLVVPITVIADRYVQFVPAYAGGPVLEDGSHLELDRTQIPAELDDVLTQLKGLLAALEPKPGQDRGPLARLIEDLDESFDGRSDELAGALEESAKVLENLADSSTDLTGLIQNLDRLFIAFADRASEIGILNDRLALVTTALVDDQENLEGTIENLASFSDEAASVLSESGEDLGQSFGRLGDVLRGVLEHQDALLEGTRWTNVIAQGLGETNSSGKGKFAYSGRQAAVGTAGAEYNYRLDTRDTIACERIDALIQSFLGLNPNASLEQLRITLMSFFPETYMDDLTYLVDLLIPLCADLPGLTAGLDERAQTMIEDLEAEIGTDALAELLVRWFMGDVVLP